MSSFYAEEYAQNATTANRPGFYDSFSGTIDYCGSTASVENATFKLTNGDIVFYNGTWKDGNWKRGTFKGGTWLSGTFVSGVWEGGLFESGTILGGIILNGKIKKALDEDGNETTKAKITAKTKKALKVAEKNIAKIKRESLSKDMSSFKEYVKKWADEHLAIDDVLKFFNFIYGGTVSMRSHTPIADALLKEYQKRFPNLKWDDIKKNYVDSTYMWCGLNVTSYNQRLTNINFYRDDGHEYIRYSENGSINENNPCYWDKPSTSGNKEAWDYFFDCYFKNKIPSEFNYIKEMMDIKISQF